MSIEIEIPSDRLTEAMQNMRNIDQLVQSLYPSYKSGSDLSATRINAAPLIKISWANLISSPGSSSGLLVAMESLSVNPDIATAGFHTATFTKGKQKTHRGETRLIPKLMRLSLSFTVLHDFTPGWNETGKALDSNFYKFPYEFQTANAYGEPVGSLSDVPDFAGQAVMESDLDPAWKSVFKAKYLERDRELEMQGMPEHMWDDVSPADF